jgi:glycosyltransferase involved in cell wall biosynthesis
MCGSIMSDKPLRIVHVTRAPVGGIFRHILDLAAGQAKRGHEVGIITDSLTGGDRAVTALDALAPQLKLGVARFPIQRELSPTDFFAHLKVRQHLQARSPDVMHGHGAKGGAFVRLMRAPDAIRAYTPHGGSLHYGRTLRGAVYGGLERILMRRTELFLFESQFACNAYQAMVGPPPAIVRVVPNGITAAEMAPIEPRPDAADLLSVGEFRHIKGTDVLIEAVAELHKAGRKVTLAMAGDGEEGAKLRELVAKLGLDSSIRFLGHTPARQAFVHGRQMVVPSRADSLPYAVIEAGGAGIPIIASGVGGIPEILGPEGSMVPPENPGRLAAAITVALDDPGKARAGADKLRARIGDLFSQDAMVEGVLAGYGEALRAKFKRSH